MSTAFIIGVLVSSILSGTSLLYATLGELIGERAGVVNLGLEGIMLIGAATGFAATAWTGNPYLGLAAAALAGMAANLIFAYPVIGRRANQLACGLSLMFFGFGLSALVGRPFVGTLITGLPRLRLPGFEGLGGRLLSYDILVWLAVPAAIFTWWLLFRTRWGLGLRAVGESPVVAYAAFPAGAAAVPGARACRHARRHRRSPSVDRAHSHLGGGNDRHIVVRRYSAESANVFFSSYVAGIFCIICLPMPAIVRYNPPHVLGHVLGQRRRDDAAENQPAERAGGGNDHGTRAPR
jgi:Branched-chain amino acid transport system / permease component